MKVINCMTEYSELFGREKELARLDHLWEDSNTHIVSLIAIGGMGKTALVAKWLARMQKDDFRGAERVFGWSFYSQGSEEDRQVSSEGFFAEALKWFGDSHPDVGSPWRKGERLAEYIKKQRTLLILDGMEPLQDPHQNWRLKDPGLQSLLKELAYDNPGLCIITTRFPIDDLQEFTQSTVQQISLEQLSPEAGAQLLESLGVIGTQEELQEVSKEYDGHALALTLLGNYLLTNHQGEIRERDKIPKLIDEEEKGGHAKRIMRSYEKMFAGEPELDVLRIMGLFDRPVSPGALDVLLQEPAIEGLTDRLSQLPKSKWKYVLRNLRNVGLLNREEPGDQGALDCHPLIREHFGEQLKQKNPDAWKEANSRLYEYYKTTSKEYPGTIEDMEPLYAAVLHGCQAGRYQETLDNIYWKRIRRGNEAFSINKLGAFGADLAAISSFFEKHWDRPVTDLSESDQGFILNAAGFCLRALGRLREASQPMKTAVDEVAKNENWKNASVGSSNLSELFLTIGDTPQALDYARQSVQYADQSGDDFQKMGNRTTLADAQHQSGLLNDAEASFREAEAMQKEMQPEYPLLYSLQGYRYCDLLLSQRKYNEVKRRAQQTVEYRKSFYSLLDIALDTLSLGRAEFMRVLQEGKGDFQEAAETLNQAVDDMRNAGDQEFVASGILARAECYRVTNDFEHAHHDLREVMTIATRGEMRLHEADCHLQYARLYLAEGDQGKAREELVKAEAMINDMGYRRRDPEVQVEYARLFLAEGDKVQARAHLDKTKELIESMGYHCLDRDVREIEGEL